MEARAAASTPTTARPPPRRALLLFAMFMQAALLAVTSGNTVDVDGSAYNVYEGYRLLETEPLDEARGRVLAAAGAAWDFWEEPRAGGRAALFVGPDQLQGVQAALRELGVGFGERPWAPPPAPPAPRARRALRAVSFTRFHRLVDIHDYLDDLAKQFPELVTVFSIGSTLEGRDLKVIRISSDGGRRYKPSAFIDAAIHAREWIAPPVALYTVFQLVENYTANRALVEDLDWYILPVLNADGYEYTFTNERFWRKTRSFNGNLDCLGVDANRNFGFHWGEAGSSGNPCSQTFGGLEEFSEPEARAVRDFVRSLAPRLNLYLTLHSYGPLLMFPWGYTTDLPQDAEELETVANAAAAALAAVRGTKYTVGSASNVLYASSGTSRDWAKGELGVKFVYTMELPPGGSGFDPPPGDILPVVQETFEAVKVLGRAAAAGTGGGDQRRPA